MQHCDADALVLASLGEPALGADEVAHIASCADCRNQLGALRRTVLSARGRSDEPPEVVPPARVWAAVAAATGVRTAPSAPPRPPEQAPGTLLVPAASPGRARRIPWYAAAAASVVAALAGVAVGLGVSTDGAGGAGDDPGDAAGTLVAVAELGPLDGGPAVKGTARVREGDSARVLELDLTGLATASGYYEVWLLDGEGGLLSVGVLTGPRPVGPALRLPQNVDLRRFSVVDVSEEPLDGDPGHSSVSVARGELVVEA